MRHLRLFCCQAVALPRVPKPQICQFTNTLAKLFAKLREQVPNETSFVDKKVQTDTRRLWNLLFSQKRIASFHPLSMLLKSKNSMNPRHLSDESSRTQWSGRVSAKTRPVENYACCGAFGFISRKPPTRMGKYRSSLRTWSHSPRPSSSDWSSRRGSRDSLHRSTGADSYGASGCAESRFARECSSTLTAETAIGAWNIGADWSAHSCAAVPFGTFPCRIVPSQQSPQIWETRGCELPAAHRQGCNRFLPDFHPKGTPRFLISQTRHCQSEVLEFSLF